MKGYKTVKLLKSTKTNKTATVTFAQIQSNKHYLIEWSRKIVNDITIVSMQLTITNNKNATIEMFNVFESHTNNELRKYSYKKWPKSKIDQILIMFDIIIKYSKSLKSNYKLHKQMYTRKDCIIIDEIFVSFDDYILCASHSHSNKKYNHNFVKYKSKNRHEFTEIAIVLLEMILKHMKTRQHGNVKQHARVARNTTFGLDLFYDYCKLHNVYCWKQIILMSLYHFRRSVFVKWCQFKYINYNFDHAYDTNTETFTKDNKINKHKLDTIETNIAYFQQEHEKELKYNNYDLLLSGYIRLQHGTYIPNELFALICRYHDFHFLDWKSMKTNLHLEFIPYCKQYNLKILLLYYKYRFGIDISEFFDDEKIDKEKKPIDLNTQVEAASTVPYNAPIRISICANRHPKNECIEKYKLYVTEHDWNDYCKKRIKIYEKEVKKQFQCYYAGFSSYGSVPKWLFVNQKFYNKSIRDLYINKQSEHRFGLGILYRRSNHPISCVVVVNQSNLAKNKCNKYDCHQFVWYNQIEIIFPDYWYD